VEQLLNVFPRLGSIFAPVGLDRHPLPKGFLDRMIRAVEWIGGRARRQQSRVPREKVLETQISAEIPVGFSRAYVIERTAANQLERLRSVLPLQRFAVEGPQIPLRLHYVRRVLVDVLRRDRRHLRRAERAFAEIPL